MADNKQNNTAKRGPGRPPGSKNKKKTSSSGAKNGSQTAASAAPDQAKYDKIKAMQEQYDRDKRYHDHTAHDRQLPLQIHVLDPLVDIR